MMTRRKLSLLISTLVLSLGPFFFAQGAEPSATGSITGTIDKPQSVTAVLAVNRADKLRYTGTIEPQTGRFTIGGLPLGKTYDCIVDFDGARLEGVNLNVPPSDYLEEQPLTQENIQIIKGKVRKLNKFEDVVEIMEIRGNIQHAVILLNKLRTRPFYGSKPGEVIWRAELWHFERPEETWLKVQDELFIVLYRERIKRSQYDRKSVTFDPALGGMKLGSTQPDVDLGGVKLPLTKPGVRFRTAKLEVTKEKTN